VNAEQASKPLTQEPTRLSYGEGCHPRGTPRATDLAGSCRGSGGGMSAEGTGRNTGSPAWWRRVTSNRRPARAGPGRTGWRRGP
jgi:hypothetical protein